MMDPMIVDSDDAADSEADDNHVRRMIQINVTSLDGDSFWLSVFPGNTIRDVKKRLRSAIASLLYSKGWPFRRCHWN